MLPASANDTILIVDDEESVRKTFREWLDGADLGCLILAAADAEEALVQANQHAIDLAILDWNLGAGTDGLQLLQDLTEFSPDVVAIMVTGFAHQATPLQAMRVGVRDYLDKNQDLTRENFLRAVRRQLERIRPAKRERRLLETARAFRTAIEQILPLVQTAAALNEPVPLSDAITSLFRFLRGATGATDGVLLVRSYDPQREPAEIYRAYSETGTLLSGELAPFARSLAGSVVSMQQPCITDRPEQNQGRDAVELQSFERGRSALLAAPLQVSPTVQAVLELFDKPGGFTEADRHLVAAASDVGSELLRQALAERQTKQMLLDAVGAALARSDSVVTTLAGSVDVPPTPGRRDAGAPTAETVLDQLRAAMPAQDGVGGPEAVRLAEAVRILARRHGPCAVRYCIDLVERLRGLLDEATGAEVLGKEHKETRP